MPVMYARMMEEKGFVVIFCLSSDTNSSYKLVKNNQYWITGIHRRIQPNNEQ